MTLGRCVIPVHAHIGIQVILTIALLERENCSYLKVCSLTKDT